MTKATISYVVLCHRNAPQVLRLARTIRAMSPRSRVLIRHDQPSGFIDAAAAEACGADLLVSKIECRWGHWSLVEATLEAFHRAGELHDPAWIVVISGQDYPIRPLEPWEDSLLADPYDAVMSSEALVDGPFGMRPGGNRQQLRMRYTHRWYRLPRLNAISRLPASFTRLGRSAWFRYLYPLQAILVLHQLPRDEGWALGIRRRTVPWSPDMPVYKGSQWIALSRRAVGVCVDGHRAKWMRDYFTTTLVPDEAYFHTLLASSRGMRVKREPISWIRWASDAHPHPVVIDQSDLEAAVRSGTPFARKFDATATPGLLDDVDLRLLAPAASETA